MGLMQDAAEAFNADDLDRFVACFAPDAILKDGTGTVFAQGHEAIRRVYAPRMRIPGRRVHAAEESSAGPSVVGVLTADPAEDGGPVVVVNRVEAGRFSFSQFFAPADPL